jgi:hypothetical protein
MRRAATTLGFLIVFSCPLSRALAETRPTYELSGGYVYLNDLRLGTTFPTGWMAGGAGRIGPVWAAGQLDGSYQSYSLGIGDVHLSVHTLMGGPRISARVGPFVEFGQLLFGVVRGHGSAFGANSSTHHFGLQPGAGLDYPLNERLAARLELDGRLIPSTDQVEVRGAVALVYVFR